MRFYLLDFSEFINKRKSRIILYGDEHIARDIIQDLRWSIKLPPFEVIKELKVKYKV